MLKTEPQGKSWCREDDMGRAFRELVHYLDVTAHVIKMAFMTIIEYPSNIAGWMISNPLQFIMGFAIIKFVVESFGAINGWNYGQLAVC